MLKGDEPSVQGVQQDNTDTQFVTGGVDVTKSKEWGPNTHNTEGDIIIWYELMGDTFVDGSCVKMN